MLFRVIVLFAMLCAVQPARAKDQSGSLSHVLKRDGTLLPCLDFESHPIKLVSKFGIPGNAPFNPGASCRGGSNEARER